MASTNTDVESVNARLRDMLCSHRGMSFLHRVKAIFWWCYMHTESPLPAAEILRVMQTDDVDVFFAMASSGSIRGDSSPNEYGDEDRVGGVPYVCKMQAISTPKGHAFRNLTPNRIQAVNFHRRPRAPSGLAPAGVPRRDCPEGGEANGRT